jgi:hypothetical protein
VNGGKGKIRIRSRARERSKQATSCCVFENPKKIRYPFLYECIHTLGCFHARMAPLGECKFAGKTCSVEGSETGVSFVSKTIRLLGAWKPTWQSFALPMDMQTTVQPVVCNEARLPCLLEIAMAGTDGVVVLPHRRYTPVMLRQLQLFSNFHDLVRSTRQTIRMTVLHENKSISYRAYSVLSAYRVCSGSACYTMHVA